MSGWCFDEKWWTWRREFNRCRLQRELTGCILKKTFVKNLRVRNVGCLKNVDLPLTRFHALIGPNDSGKSTILRALEALFSFAAADGSSRTGNPWISKIEQGKWIGTWEEGRSIECDVSGDNVLLRYSCKGLPKEEQRHQGFLLERFEEGGEKGKESEIVRQWQVKRRENLQIRHKSGKKETGPVEAWRPILSFLSGSVWILRFDPDMLRQPSELIPEGSENTFFGGRGKGLPGVFDLVFNRGDDSREKLQNRIRELFPTVKNLRLRNVSSSAKELQVELTDGTLVPAQAMSEGMLYFLAFAVLQYMESPSIILVEEPENGLHPARVADVVRVLEEVSKDTQVIMATHSPLVINEMSPENVTLVTRDDETGTRVTSLPETRDFEERSKIYQPGELWLSYADGDKESKLQKSDSEELGEQGHEGSDK